VCGDAPGNIGWSVIFDIGATACYTVWNRHEWRMKGGQMFEEDIDPEARHATSTTWVEHEVRRLLNERDEHARRWCDLGRWLQQHRTPDIAVNDVLRYMGLRDPRSDETGTP